MKSFRTVLFWLHLVVGVAGAVVILIMAATGVLLTFERQMIASADAHSYKAVAPMPGAVRLSVEPLLARVQAGGSGETPSAVMLRSDPRAAAEVSFGRERTVFIDPYTGLTLGEGEQATRNFFHTVTDLHRWLGAQGDNRDVGKAITGASNLGFLFLVVSGIYLWWPRKWTRPQVRNVTVFRRRLSPKARDFNWHNVIGFWSSLPLFLIVLSAVVISYPWASDLVYRAVGEEPPPPRRGPGGRGRGGAGRPNGREGAGRRGERTAAQPLDVSGLDRLWARAEQQMPGWNTISLRVPTSAEDPATFTIDGGTGGQPQHRGQLTLDRATGQVVQWETFGDNTPGRRLRTFFRFAHTGEFGGIVGQTLAGLASLGATVLVWTGLSLSLRRLRSWRKRQLRDKKPAAQPHVN